MFRPTVLSALLVTAAAWTCCSCNSKKTARQVVSQAENDQKRITIALESMKPAPPRQRGVALGLYCEDSGWSYEPLLKEIAAVGASHVSLVVGYYLKDIHDTAIRSHPRFTAPDRVLRRTIAQARTHGLKVLLFPILRVLNKPTPDHWRGNLKPKDKDALRASYIRLMTRLAGLAAAEQVSVFSIGSELSSLDTDPGFFEPVVRAVRAAFNGKILYSANWDHFQKVRIWPLVDLAGLCGYFGIAIRAHGATLAEMVEGWRDVKVWLTRWAKKIKRGLVFTEVGYMSQTGSARAPWDEGARRPVDLEEQRKAYEAFVRVWNGTPELEGAYIWNWYGWGGPGDRSYTPRAKPAARVISWWYGGRWPIRWWRPR
jgi:hypothetical protein